MANSQSIPLPLVTISTAPAAVVGVVVMLYITGSTLNIQSYIGAIMAVGVGMANAILLVPFAERERRAGATSLVAAIRGAGSRLRAILMTSFAMVAGMVPMALAFGEGGQHNAPLGREVIGGRLAATAATLLVLPAVFAVVQARAPVRTASIDPDDAASVHYDRNA